MRAISSRAGCESALSRLAVCCTEPISSPIHDYEYILTGPAGPSRDEGPEVGVTLRGMARRPSGASKPNCPPVRPIHRRGTLWFVQEGKGVVLKPGRPTCVGCGARVGATITAFCRVCGSHAGASGSGSRGGGGGGGGGGRNTGGA